MVTAEEGDGVGDDWWPPQVQKIYWTSLYFSLSLGFFVQMCVDSWSLCMLLVGACIVWVLYTYVAWYNTGVFYQKKKRAPAAAAKNRAEQNTKDARSRGWLSLQRSPKRHKPKLT